jgi:signal transduction histidine kinase
MGAEVAPRTVPVGFGRGRRSNTLAVLQVATVGWAEAVSEVEQWAPEEGASTWEMASFGGFMNGAVRSGFDLVWRIWRMGETPAGVAASLATHDAVIIPAPYDEQMPAVTALLDAGVPVVLAYSRTDDPRACWVACDNRGALVQVVRHLVRLGHQGIGFAGGPRFITDFREREQGYLSGMKSAGLQVNPAWVTAAGVNREPAAVKALVAPLLEAKERPTALVCAADPLALGVMEHARELGLRIPEDLAVTGFDDTPDATQVIPHLTTVRQPTVEIANHACYLAACCVMGQRPVFDSWRLDLPTTLLIRDSCGAAAGIAARVEGVGTGPGAVREELEWRIRQLTAMNQEMQELLSVASHDLRAPLVTIQGFARSLRRKFGETLDERGRHYLQRIEHSVGNMRELIDSLLTLSRAHNQPLTLEPVYTRQVVLRVLADLKGMIAEKGARVQVGRRMPSVLADEVALYQVFQNLLTNALKYLGDQPAPFIAVNCKTHAEQHEFTVLDNGIGIASEDHEEVFQAFRRLGQVDVEGAGIGLSIVKRIVLRHGGRVWVDSQPGQGAAFRFTLPRRDLGHDHSETERNPDRRG